jgi:Glycosyl transferases group 1
MEIPLKSTRLRSSPKGSPLGSPRGSSPRGTGGAGGSSSFWSESAWYMMLRCVRYSLLIFIPLAMILSLTNNIRRPWDPASITNDHRVTTFEDSPPSHPLPLQQQQRQPLLSIQPTTSDNADKGLIVRVYNRSTTILTNVVQPTTLTTTSDVIGPSADDGKQPTSSDDTDVTTTSTTTPDSLSSAALGDLQSYNASLHPIIEDYLSYLAVLDKKKTKKATSPPKVQVHFAVDVGSSVAPQSKFILDGLERSQYIQVVGITFVSRLAIKTVQVHERNDQQPLIWVVDWGSMDRDCHVLDRILRQQQQQQRAQNDRNQLVLIDYSGSTRQTTCSNRQLTIPKERIRLVKRNIVQNRHYDLTQHQMHLGEVIPNQGLLPERPVLHAPMVLREVFVAGLQGIDSQPAYRKTKSIDVAMFWDAGFNTHYGFLRRDVSVAVQAMHGSLAGSSKSIQALVQLVGNDDDGMEVGNVQGDYVRQLISAKIVVCAGRDEWEDQYRLMESLASGALVMTDRMLTLPEGLHNKTNILIFEDIPKLEQLIRYYLNPKNEEKRRNIAKNGWILAMSRHRSWHRMEELFFGRPLTLVDQPYEPSPTKIKHPSVDLVTSETFR